MIELRCPNSNCPYAEPICTVPTWAFLESQIEDRKVDKDACPWWREYRGEHLRGITFT